MSEVNIVDQSQIELAAKNSITYIEEFLKNLKPNSALPRPSIYLLAEIRNLEYYVRNYPESIPENQDLQGLIDFGREITNAFKEQ